MLKEATQRSPAAVAARAFIAMGREGFGERFRPCQPGEPPLYNPRSLKHQRSAHERPAAMKLLLEDGTEISGRAFGAAHQPSAVPCPNRLTSENGMDRPRSRPRRHAECAGGLSGEGALPCFGAATVHAVTAIGIDMGKNTAVMKRVSRRQQPNESAQVHQADG